MNILAIFAHPDDEVLFAGGTLALLSRAGHAVHFVSATRGEGGETGEPPVCMVDELGEAREKELLCAVRALGGVSLEFLGYVDPRVGEGDELYAFKAEREVLQKQVFDLLFSHRIDGVITHGSNGEYGHPAHRLVHEAVFQVVTSLGDRAPLLYTTQAAFPGHPKPRVMNKDDPAHLVVDITPAFEQKVQAALCHASQNASMVRRSSREAGRQLSVPEVIVRQESFHRVFPKANGKLEDDLASILAPYLITRI